MTTDFNVEDKVKYLAAGMFYLGFGDRHTPKLAEKISAGEEAFQIMHAATWGKKEVRYDIDFKKSNEGDLVSLSGYRVTLKDDPSKTQYFSVYKNNGISAKQAFNMVEGRAVCKTQTVGDIKLDTWHKLDMHQKTKNGNYVQKMYNRDQRFSVDRGLGNMPWSQSEGKGMPSWAAEDLRKGNPVQGTLCIEGKDVDARIEIDLTKREVQAYDAAGALVAVGTGLSERELSRQQERNEQMQQGQKEGASQVATNNNEPEAGQQQNKGALEMQDAKLPFEPDTQQEQSAGQQATQPGTVDNAIKNDPVQKNRNGKDKSNEPVQRMPRGSHPALEGDSPSKGRKR